MKELAILCEFITLDLTKGEHEKEWAKGCGLIEKYPHLIDYLDRLISRPAYPKELFEY